MVTARMLRAAGVSDDLVSVWAGPLTEASDEWEIYGDRAVPWVANLAYESNGFRDLTENLNYSADRLMAIWPCTPRRSWGFTYDESRRFARKPEEIANRVYANRMGNGNASSGDGWRYRGRGPIQLTGRDNYREFGSALGLDLEESPELALEPRVAARIAGRYWATRGCNDMADDRDYSGIRRAINGGLNGNDAVVGLVRAISRDD